MSSTKLHLSRLAIVSFLFLIPSAAIASTFHIEGELVSGLLLVAFSEFDDYPKPYVATITIDTESEWASFDARADLTKFDTIQIHVENIYSGIHEDLDQFQLNHLGNVGKLQSWTYGITLQFDKQTGHGGWSYRENHLPGGANFPAPWTTATILSVSTVPEPSDIQLGALATMVSLLTPNRRRRPTS